MQEGIFITDVQAISKEEWSNFVLEHPHGNIFQTPEMFEVYTRTKNFKPSIVVKTNSDSGKIEGLMMAPIISEKGGILKYFISRVIGFGTPIVNSIEDTLPLTEKFISKIKKTAIYSSIINLYDNKDSLSTLSSLGFKFDDHLNFIFDLTQREEELWSNISSTRRKQIKRAYNRGLSVKVSNSVSSIEGYYKILRETYDRASLPLFHISLFQNVLEIMGPKNYVKFFSAFDNNELVAHRIVFTYKNEIYDWYAGNTTESQAKYPNDLLVWEVLKWGCNNGYRSFNFGGAGKPNQEYGVRDFKKTFGGKLVNYGDYTCVHNPVIFFMISVIKKHFRTLIRRMLK